MNNIIEKKKRIKLKNKRMKWERNEGKEEGKNQIKNELIFNLQPHSISHLKCRTSTCRTILFK